MCYWLITETRKLVSNKSVENVTIDDYFKLDIDSMFDELNKNLTERLYNENFQVNSDVDGKFDFILPDKDLIKNLGVNYSSGVTPRDEDYDDMIVKRRPIDKEEVVDKYLKMNLIFDVGTNDERRVTVVKLSWVLDGRVIFHLHTKPFFDTREY